MRVLPVLNTYNCLKNKSMNQTQFEKNRDAYRPYHKYTGCASADLAYASMFDNKIARDLKLMGLI